jgi:hypothetical protein
MLRSLVFLAAAILFCALLPATAGAQQPAASNPTIDDCSTIQLKGQMSIDQVNFARACYEAERVRRDIDNAKGNWFRITPEQGTLFAGVIALLTATLGYLLKHANEKNILDAQIKEDRFKSREQRILSLMDDLTGPNPARQRLAIAGLMRIAREKPHRSQENTSATAPAMMITVLVARLGDDDLSPGVTKYAADELRKIFIPASSKQKAEFLMRDFNLQNARLVNAFLAGVDASGVDFFEADLSRASLRDANLRGTILCGATLFKTVFAGADLEDANLRGADLKGARLREARNLDKALFDKTTVWDNTTEWPEGFNPAARGLGPAS